MKTLTICQPYPRLILILEKPVENRTWPISYRGPLLIHAGKSRDWMDDDDEKDAIDAGDPLVFGAILGRCNLVACLRVEEIEAGKHDARYPQLISRAHCFGPWCWVLEDVQRFDTPLFCNGKQGLWDFPDSLLLACHAGGTTRQAQCAAVL